MIIRSVTVIFLFFIVSSETQRLVGTHIIFRHGERTPSYLYPTDPNDSLFWPNGLGSLTVRGQLQHIRLGQFIREQYSSILNSTYVASEITIRSSDYDRTLMSAYSNLAGLYPTSNKFQLAENFVETSEWPEQLPWQPIPVHTVPKSIDHLMGVSSCDRYEELVDDLRNSARILSFNDEFRDLFTYLEEHTRESIKDIFIAWDIADTVLIEDLFNATPHWINATILRQLRLIEDLSFYHLFYPPEINRLRGGPIINDILENIQNLKSNNKNGKKVKIYSGHDTTIAPILSFLDVNHVHQPPFASTLFFDVYQQDDEIYFIQLRYLNMTNGQNPHIVRLPGCSAPMCPLETFIQLYQSKLPGNMNEECQSKRIKRTYPRIHRVSFASD